MASEACDTTLSASSEMSGGAYPNGSRVVWARGNTADTVHESDSENYRDVTAL